MTCLYAVIIATCSYTRHYDLFIRCHHYDLFIRCHHYDLFIRCHHYDFKKLRS
jgi:hypothetical protein